MVFLGQWDEKSIFVGSGLDTILIWIGENGISCLRRVCFLPLSVVIVDTSDEQLTQRLVSLGQEFSQALKCWKYFRVEGIRN